MHWIQQVREGGEGDSLAGRVMPWRHSHKPCSYVHRVTCVAFSPESRAAGASCHLLAGLEDGQLRSWDALTGSTLRKHAKKGAEICSLIVLDRCIVHGHEARMAGTPASSQAEGGADSSAALIPPIFSQVTAACRGRRCQGQPAAVGV